MQKQNEKEFLFYKSCTFELLSCLISSQNKHFKKIFQSNSQGKGNLICRLYTLHFTTQQAITVKINIKFVLWRILFIFKLELTFYA